ncbi:protein-disulfide reductase DsbD domain-containing protein [Paracoccus aeridis]|uniref:protein-disulfide reductase DsbD domain-containing protein n=1 Tax=Paracoccus aeridis TaxID=1966466 RepID=UPI0010AA25BD|nr:protein-disulfide reductase DsbD domain-containing protein [Paracoccus aeridis]
MNAHPALIVLVAALATTPAAARDRADPPGLRSAELLPVATAPDGSRVTAMRLVLEPGWKTYWRSPGDSGMPPGFDWSGSTNLAAAEPQWPRPEVILSDGDRTLGYHDELVLPFQVRPQGPGPVALDVTVTLGLCENVCVPATLRLTASDAAGGPDPRIGQALALVPAVSTVRPACRLADISDGVRLSAALPDLPGDPAVAMELAEDGIWVSQPDLARAGGRLTATADFVPPAAAPFPLDPAKLRVTVIGDGNAVEYRGCAPS